MTEALSERVEPQLASQRLTSESLRRCVKQTILRLGSE